MNTSMDTANRPLQGPITPISAPLSSDAEEMIQAGQFPTAAPLAPVVPATVTLGTKPPVVVAAPPVEKDPLEIKIVSNRYADALDARRKSEAKIVEAKTALATATAEAARATEQVESLRQELLLLLAK